MTTTLREHFNAEAVNILEHRRLTNDVTADSPGARPTAPKSGVTEAGSRDARDLKNGSKRQEDVPLIWSDLSIALRNADS